MDFLQPIYIAVIGISFLVSLTVFRYGGPLYLKIFCVLLGLTFAAEIIAVYVNKIFKLGIRNLTYNVFMPVEFCLYVVCFRYLLPNKKTLTAILFILIILIWVVSTVVESNLRVWNSYIANAGCCCAIILAACYYIQLLTIREPVKLQSQPAFYIATGMLLFYSCQLPFLGTINYVAKHYPILSRHLLAVLRIVIIVTYSLFTYAYICHLNQRKSLSP
jgi:hypothetical protein